MSLKKPVKKIYKVIIWHGFLMEVWLLKTGFLWLHWNPWKNIPEEPEHSLHSSTAFFTSPNIYDTY